MSERALRLLNFELLSTCCRRQQKQKRMSGVRSHFYPLRFRRRHEARRYKFPRIVIFNPLGRENVREIIDKFVSRLSARLSEQNIRLTLDEPLYSLLMEKGYSDEFGARPMERTIEQLLAQPLARMILEERIKPGQQLTAKVENGRVIFSPAL
jgi:ATP-dependent Clp protease ATP-binding subunit ClpA